MHRQISLPPGASLNIEIGLLGCWWGTRTVTGVEDKLALQARLAAECDMSTVIRTNREDWQAFFEKVPSPPDDLPEELRRLYYKAWTSTWYNTMAGDTDMIWYRTEQPIGVCCKIAPSTMAMCPATWESALIALLVSLVDPKLAACLLEAIFTPQDPDDGYLGELPGMNHLTQLPIVEPFIAWAIWKQGKDTTWLARIYPKLRRSLLYKTRHPSWGHHGPFMVRNYSYCHIAGLYLRQIADVLKRPEAECKQLDTLITSTRIAVHTYWDDEGGYYRCNFLPGLTTTGPNGGRFDQGTDAETLIPLFKVAKERVRPRLLDVIRDEFITKDGIIRRKPLTLPKGSSGSFNAPQNQSDFSLKESNWLFLPKAIKDADPELFQKLANGTLTNIRQAGDFYECYTLDGQGRHNGPGSIFGAFAVIWSILLRDDQVDWLYD